PITNIIGDHFNGKEANATKEAILQNSGFLDGMVMKDAIGEAVNKIEELQIGKRKVNYRMRDAGFSRQRYWGEPFPIIWSDGIAVALEEKELPLELPFVEKYGPGKDGEGPLSNLTDWVITPTGKRETSTMPGYAGSSWYFLRYMDPHNNETFADKKATDYWNQVDVYIGGTEHAVGHLLYSRLWTKILYDLGYISFDEPYKKLVNQGMIQGSSRFMYRVKDSNKFVSFGQKDNYETNQLHVDVNIVDGIELDIEAFKKSKPEFSNAEFILEDGKYFCGVETEKMSKSKYNTVNPNELVNKYGADTFRMYEMFLGPIEQSKPWDTKGIEGVHRFLKKMWRLFFDEINGPVWTSSAPSPLERAGGEATDSELKTLHKTIKKIEEDTERFSFNTAVSAFMVCVNELTDQKCHKKEILQPMLILLAPYAPHIAEDLYHSLGNTDSVLNADYPKLENKYLVESEKEYPISINGKLRTTMVISLDASQPEVEQMVLQNDIVQKWIDGKSPKKIIFVKNKMVNVVV
ncbi:MAG: class I tRNA ligase family protein, partial [Ginsengibacter sp.]